MLRSKVLAELSVEGGLRHLQSTVRAGGAVVVNGAACWGQRPDFPKLVSKKRESHRCSVPCEDSAEEAIALSWGEVSCVLDFAGFRPQNPSRSNHLFKRRPWPPVSAELPSKGRLRCCCQNGRARMSWLHFLGVEGLVSDEAALLAAFNGPQWMTGASTATPLSYTVPTVLSPLPCPSTAWSIKNLSTFKFNPLL
ncbi:hypothetical protein N657DRAFT_650666 [Parathielavia appendiculata]|uniref:Uncharacterized protein n=1 Tax=Parathielavia appendiculata TaxID=2587402 RepID=A0AAN6YYL0_9PEZI|nr:hypothetical protein N657DRAFT_650666 [Parathielavia appendiculata]